MRSHDWSWLWLALLASPPALGEEPAPPGTEVAVEALNPGLPRSTRLAGDLEPAPNPRRPGEQCSCSR